ncbi:hypothetical protein OQA88_10805 [Cercophora sp. LCS_1]
MPSLPQLLLALTLLISSIGSHYAFTPPSPSSEPPPSPTDILGRASRLSRPSLPLPLTSLITFLLSLHLALLVLTQPSPPPSLLRNARANRLNPSLLTWTRHTTIPLLLNIFIGVPLRLISYGTLGSNFTFTLAQPTELKTDGIYKYVQHPSYTGLMACFPVLMMLWRVDGVLASWIPVGWYSKTRRVLNGLGPVWVGWMVFLIGTRVVQEEQMLREKFGAEWEVWHRGTARFVPYVF